MRLYPHRINPQEASSRYSSKKYEFFTYNTVFLRDFTRFSPNNNCQNCKSNEFHWLLSSRLLVQVSHILFFLFRNLYSDRLQLKRTIRYKCSARIDYIFTSCMRQCLILCSTLFIVLLIFNLINQFGFLIYLFLKILLNQQHFLLLVFADISGLISIFVDFVGVLPPPPMFELLTLIVLPVIMQLKLLNKSVFSFLPILSDPISKSSNFP